MGKKSSPESMIEREMRHSGGQAKIMPVPASMRPTRSSLQKLEKEISAQTDENENVRARSAMLSDRNYSVNLQITKIARHTSDFDFEEGFEEI